MEKFLSIILVSIIVLYLIKIIGKLLLRYWVSKKINNMANGWGSAFNNAANNRRNDNTTSRKEGEVHIDNQTYSSKRVNKNVGDYIDYEDISNK